MSDMVSCIGCGKEIHNSALSCPSCGAIQPVKLVYKEGFNWFAFAFSGTYYAGKGQWKKGIFLAFLRGIPFVTFLVPFYAGKKANKEIPVTTDFNWKIAIMVFIFESILVIQARSKMKDMINSNKSTSVSVPSHTENVSAGANTNSAPVSSNVEKISTNSDSIPSDENSFIQIVQKAQEKSKDAANDMQKGGIKSERDKEMCKLMKGESKNWIGQIAKIDADSDGKGVVEIDIANKIKLKTYDNSLFDKPYGTLLSPTSQIFKTVSTMKVGQSVKFTGLFFSSDEGECLKEQSITLTGKISAPEFVFKFTKIDAI